MSYYAATSGSTGSTAHDLKDDVPGDDVMTEDVLVNEGHMSENEEEGVVVDRVDPTALSSVSLTLLSTLR